ncbi:MAG: MXAN_5808 family serine peptidase [Polyangia bacterium]|nr:MXAN_5808 family serine peptidase [Polyangia bacterium]
MHSLSAASRRARAAFVLVAFAGVLGSAVSAACAQSASRQPPHDLTKLVVVNNVLSKVRTRYVEPARLQPVEMLRKALERVQQAVPEVIVRFKGNQHVEIQANTQRQTFPLEGVDSPWALSASLRGIFRFIQANLHPETKRRDVEYAAVDGLLSTLDCHSVLLRPEFFGEMQIHTQGSFGGLGITISRCGHPAVLTVVKPIEGTPAFRAGLQAGDQILRIDREDTVNMTLNEAVKRLRGDPGSKVNILVRRKGQAGRQFTLERDRILIRAVEHRMLADGVGYLQLKNFQTTTDWELRMALEALGRQGMKGLVLDLRGNGGGLLSKAISVADAFLYSGTIVTTVEHGVKRRESRANWGNTLAGQVPLAVLVDGGTASASEIVAGALKNLDRAVIIGQRTYGKGSVQVIYPNSDRSGFKVTIAQYLTPGDRSIQGIGVIPDIELLPVEVKKGESTYFASGADFVREGDRACSLTRASLALRTPPERQIYHLADDPPRGFRCEPCGAGPDWRPPPDPDIFHLDYAIKVASRVLLGNRSASRRRVLAGVRNLLQEEQRVEGNRIAEKLQKLEGVDWSAPPTGAASPRLTAVVSVGREGVVNAGEDAYISVTVTNAPGAGPAYRVRGLLYSTNPLLQHREVFIGRVDAGQTRTAQVKLKVPKASQPRADELSVRFFADGPKVPASSCTVLRIRERPKPKFAYTWQIVDDVRGNGDGRIQQGEEVRLLAQVKNVGKGASGETYLRLKSESGDAITVKRGLFQLSKLEPGATRSFELDFKVMENLPLPRVKLKLEVQDCELGVTAGETLDLPVAKEAEGSSGARGLAIPVREGVPLYQSTAARHVIGWTSRGATFAVEAKAPGGAGEGFLRVTLGKLSSAFVRRADVTLRDRGGARPALRWRWLPAQPELELGKVVDVTDRSTLDLQGVITDEVSITDVYVSVRRLLQSPDRSRIIGADYRKVFYQASAPETKRRMSFQAEVPLWEGSNLVTVTVRGRDRNPMRRSYRVLRTACQGGRPAALPDAAVR